MPQLTVETFDQAVEIFRPLITAVLGTELVRGKRSFYLVAGNRDGLASEFEILFGDTRETWEHPYDNFARTKAEVSARTGLPSDQVAKIDMDLVEEGDPEYAGGVVEGNTVVGGSGFKDYLDKVFSQCFLHIVRGLLADLVVRDRENPLSSGFYGQPLDNDGEEDDTDAGS